MYTTFLTLYKDFDNILTMSIRFLLYLSVCVSDDIEEYVNQEYISKKFEIGPTRLWGDIITKISNLVFNSNMTKFKFDDFLQVLSILNKY